jgi:hypothetical protein
LHALLTIVKQVATTLGATHPIDHPMEQHSEAISRFGPPDGTLKIYDLPIAPNIDKYREQAETNEMFDAHNDGLGYGGKVTLIAMMLDKPPLWGGYTYFQNMIGVAIALAETDRPAFRSLFTPDAITALRPRGKGAIKVSSPVLYINDQGLPQIFYREPSGEYVIHWRQGDSALDRARRVLERFAAPFAPASTFVHFVRPGEGVLVQNEHVVHGRTPFLDDEHTARTLARKWYTRNVQDATYKHVPGMNVARSYLEHFGELFSENQEAGEWHFDPAVNDNVKLS